MTLEKAKLWRSVVARSWGGRKGWVSWAQRISRAVKILCDTFMKDICHYSLSKHIDYTAPKGNNDFNVSM